MINFYKKKQNLILGLLIAAFLFLIFAQTVSVTTLHPDVAVKDFSLFRPASVPTQGDCRTVLGIFEDEIGEGYSFDHLFNCTYALFIFGLVALFLCFKQFNKGFISKAMIFIYSLWSLYLHTLTINYAYMVKTYDYLYIAKLAVIALIALLSLASIIMLLKELSKNGWLKLVNVHIFLNSISALLMMAATAIMFIPFEFERKTASIMGYMLLPANYNGGFANVFERTIADFNINSVVIIPVLLFVLAILGGIFCVGYHKNIAPTLLSIAWGIVCILGCFINPLMVLDSKIIIYIVISAAVIATGIVNLIQFKKANEIYK